MIKPKQNFIITGFFNRYISWIISRHFQKVTFNWADFDEDKSILLIANHFSWWDGFLLYHLNKIYFKKAFHIMVLNDTMQKVGFMKYLGAFSVTKNSREVIGSLDYAAGLLNENNNMVVIFPQGKLYSNFVDRVEFEKGLSRITAQAPANFQYVLSASFIEHFQYKKPSVFMGLKVLDKADIATPEQLHSIYQQHYQLTKSQQTRTTV
ncbi:lysophospholipid acyltransferase family protein [Mucilaginibacter sp. HMF5004]|uniref:lysophospholipid acyltransferase family protein n=1 Tax=Mucilaginibacter rivuli TaxID=2857527 RepID=UPI001C5E26D3|nr:lysophospholipid acyltransferase family protein [Mucilaginibacter rivuli]MBW4891265.1 lysophospholipid acyltransferase family protein [Mucilaginibacter rivuli]